MLKRHFDALSQRNTNPARHAICVALVAMLLLGAAGCAPERVAFVGGEVITVDADDRVVRAFGIEGDRIAVVGTDEEVRAWAGEVGAAEVSLEGRSVLPGFIDAHGHFPGEGFAAVAADLNAPPIGDVEALDGLVAKLEAFAADAPEGEWVVGMGYDDTLLAEQRHPNRDDLDRVSTAHPVAVLHISGHLAVLNSRALEELGVDADTPDPEGGVYRRRPGSSEPDGVVEETPVDAIRKKIMPGAAATLEFVRSASELALSNGVTTVQSGYAEELWLRGLDWATWLGVIPLRVVAFPDAAAADRIMAGEYESPDWDPSTMRFGAVKLVADGSIQGYTGYLAEPYHVAPGDDPSFRGYPRIAREELFRLVDRYHAAGLQLAVHGNGDASIDDILDAFEAAYEATPRSDARHIIIHAQMARADQLDRMKAMGIIPSFFSLHTLYWGDRHRTIFMGPERAARMSPAASAIARDLPFTIHCDAPVVPMEPLRLIWAAVNRRTRSDFVIGPEERIPVMEAIRATTATAAWQHFEEADKGSLEAGKLADFVIVSASPLSSPASIDEIRVLETWIGGERLYRAAEVSAAR